MKKGAAGAYITGFVTSLVIAYVMALLVAYTEFASVSKGLALGLLVGAGIVVVFGLQSRAFTNKNYGLFAVDSGYQMVSVIIMTLIVAAWQ